MISVTILNKNSERTLGRVLRSLQDFCEVIVLDTGSADNSLQLARSFSNVVVYCTDFTGFGPLHNYAASLARYDWILSLDSDEALTPSLKEEILHLALDDRKVYSLQMQNYFNGKRIRYSGWQNDRHVRLYNRTKTKFTDAYVHEGVISEGFEEVFLRFPVEHYSYSSIADFLTKMQHYSELFAKENKGKKSSSLGKAMRHAFGAFLKSYFLKRGFLDGYEGVVIATYNANTAFYKYLKLREANKR